MIFLRMRLAMQLQAFQSNTENKKYMAYSTRAKTFAYTRVTKISLNLYFI